MQRACTTALVRSSRLGQSDSVGRPPHNGFVLTRGPTPGCSERGACFRPKPSLPELASDTKASNGSVMEVCRFNGCLSGDSFAPNRDATFVQNLVHEHIDVVTEEAS